MTAPKVPMDALRQLARADLYWPENARHQEQLRAYIDAATAMERDESLAWMMMEVAHETCGESFEAYKARWPTLWSLKIKAARAARAHIAKEQQ